MTAGGRIRGVFRLSFAFALLAWARPAKAQTAYGFVPVTPCRIADTRNATGPFGGPALASQSSRSFAIPSSACGIPSTAAAYSLNVTVVPSATLGYVTVWPTGQAQPLVSTLNSLDGRIKSNAAIVPAGTSGAVSVFATDATNVILDINGYFVPVTNSAALAFYPVTPCRVADTRNASGRSADLPWSAIKRVRFPCSEFLRHPGECAGVFAEFHGDPPGLAGISERMARGASAASGLDAERPYRYGDSKCRDRAGRHGRSD
jgi:hypothetical protein